MPRRNAHRLRGPESDVAVRVALERERRGMSAAELARRMTEAGCPMNQSAINKIEQGDPPRRITVDELAAFARVFELEIEELMLPPHVARQKDLVATYQRMSQLEISYRGIAETLGTEASRLLSLLNQNGPDAAVREALALYEKAWRQLGDTLNDLGEEVRTALHTNPFPPDAKPTLKDMRLPRPTAHERRAAEAAAGRSSGGRRKR